MLFLPYANEEMIELEDAGRTSTTYMDLSVAAACSIGEKPAEYGRQLQSESRSTVALRGSIVGDQVSSGLLMW